MKTKLPMIARILLGLIFSVFGVIGLLNLIPQPPNLPEKLVAFNTGLMAAGYFFPLLKLTEIACGLMLLANRFVPLALVVLAPISLNIFLVHAFLAPTGLPMAIFIGLLMVYLSFFAKPYSEKIKTLFIGKA
ncbi:MAG: DoxX family membrane protein [Oligoflexia bacterium]|nr:DoxX family membrane protein [Oligoflexia bacterium]